MDVAAVAFSAATPTPRRVVGRLGSCARCGTRGRLVATRSVVSKTFTSYEHWAAPAGGGLCPACAWTYTDPGLRALPHLVTRTPATLAALGRRDVFAHLNTGALAPDAALSVPLRPGRQHVMAHARWGHLTTERTSFPWSARDALRLTVLAGLRERGFTPRMMAAPAPDFTILHALPKGGWALVIDGWKALAPWREEPSLWMAIALFATTSKSTS